MTLGWEVSFPAQKDKFGKDSDMRSTCCPTGMDDVCEMQHRSPCVVEQFGVGKGGLKEFPGSELDIAAKALHDQ